MVIYLTTNLINGKKYIGKSVRNDKGYLGSGNRLKRAILKYGKEAFKKEILYETDSKEELNKMEQFYISLYKADQDDNFYNIAKGGTGGIVWSKEKCHLCEPIFEIDPQTLEIIKTFESGKEAAAYYNIPYKNLNAVLNKWKKTVCGKVFVKVNNYDLLDLKFRAIHDSRRLYFSLRTGIFYFKKKELWLAEYSHISFGYFDQRLHGKKGKSLKNEVLILEPPFNVKK